MDRQQLGRQGETLACRALRRLGYAILDRRYRTRFGELDIVARDAATLVFVEVKTRTVESHGTALEAVTATKRRTIVAMARDYLTRRRAWEGPSKFDVVGVTIAPGTRPRIAHVINAFDVDR
ncbi:MAG TPA: YraN family protein [Acidobacteria bacterium]|jgi:putative endonuclease|nr:YraN family protein [Vicinamibacterales bacterium]HAK56216.1 YraN family protein [Acidobacteriota bacterium]|tara:strand:- start:449 stop:814 length:366 start_codon:yes stop_codon:yes gene_type:complete